MISQVSVQNISGQNPFREFKTQQNGYLFTTKKDTKQVKDGSAEKQSHKLGISIGVTALVVGFGVLALMKGFMPKGTSKNLDKLKNFLEKKVANIKNKKSVTKMEEFYIFSLRRVESFIKKSESINNLTSLKDALFQKMMFGKDGKWKFGRKIHEGVTRFFEKISRRTVLRNYKNTQKEFSNMSNHFGNVNKKLLADPNRLVTINGQTKPVSYWIARVNTRSTIVNSNYQSGFGEGARKARYLYMKRSCEGLDQFFWDKSFKDVKNFKSKTMYQTFIADDFISANKMTQTNNIGRLRQLITHDIDDNYNAAKLALNNVEKFVNPSDRATFDVIKKLRNRLDYYKTLSGNNEVNARLKLNKEISRDFGKLVETFKSSSVKYKYNEEAVSQISKYITDVDEIISKSSKGELQEILTIYKGILPRKEYLVLKDKVNTAVKSLDKSIDIETTQFFDKLRDLKVGSAPTDVISIVASAGAIGWGLTRAKDKDEKYSVMLKAGIPVLAAMGTSLYCAASLINGGKSIAVGLLSGLIMNKVGVYADDMRKKFNEKVKPNLTLKQLQKPQVQPNKV